MSEPLALLCQYKDGFCTQCGQPLAPRFYRTCKPGVERKAVAVIHPPSFAGKAMKYSRAVTKWMAAGSPRRSEEEIQRIFAICEACPLFDAASSSCTKCGCKCSRSASGFKNKLAQATEICPDKPPRWQ